MRLVRSSMLEVMDSEFVKLARIKGLSEGVVIWKHCLRNALIPVLTLWGVFVGNLITGAIVTETVFAWPGVGRLTYEAVIYRDFPLLQAVIILKAILILAINLVRRHPLRLCRSAHPARLSRRSPLDGSPAPPVWHVPAVPRIADAFPRARATRACRGSRSSSSR